jgi:hypothetical protein
LEVAKRNQDSKRGAAMTDDTLSPLSNVISIDDERIRNHLDRIVRGSVEEETLNALLEAEADRLCNAQRMNAPRYDGKRAPATTSASCSPRLGRCG